MCPAGAVFPETLEMLGVLEQDLLYFSGTSNLMAVRWLLQMGANWDTCDINDTTCLHAACRSGSVPIVQELIGRGHLIRQCDAAGWTPLHVAAHLSRCEIVVTLLNAQANVQQTNSHGQTAIELCLDGHTKSAFTAFNAHMLRDPTLPWHFDFVLEEPPAPPKPTPFFTPQDPIADSHKSMDVLIIGTRIFNKDPGFGFAFVRAVGAVLDYPSRTSRFLRRDGIDSEVVGVFLSRPYTLCNTVRLAFFSSCCFLGSGIVSALVEAFKDARLPDNLQNVDRLLGAVAFTWWDEHESDNSFSIEGGDEYKGTGGKGSEGDGRLHSYASEEVRGFELKSYLASAESLQQLMFSAVCLHRFVHGNGKTAKRKFDLETWFALHHAEVDTSILLPAKILLDVWDVVSKQFIPELCMVDSTNMHSGHALPAQPLQPPKTTWLQGFAHMDGWVDVISEPAGVLRNSDHSIAWVSVACGFLFLSTHAGSDAPYACLSLRGMSAHVRDAVYLVLSPIGREGDDGSPSVADGIDASCNNLGFAGQHEQKSPIRAAWLESDGSWKELRVLRLELAFETSQLCGRWLARVGETCHVEGF
eukprot:TRINITY_DN90944_c0_g1_i1.p1 TRINITY_DN90944_c0_g1~~TRINITY_DN90944_c0_g1_i1.p1  ORF type:complete len:649 (-),score=82.00 TRINITY_DN90944_c0_g1_i1:191-1948(-)